MKSPILVATLLAMGASLAAMPAAAQQMPVVTLHLEPAEQTLNITSGGTGSGSLQLNFSANNFVCTQNQPVTVTLTLAGVDETLGWNATSSLAEATFTLPTGVHATPQTRVDAPQQAVSVDVSLGPVVHTTHEFTLTAAFGGGDFANCKGGAPFPSPTLDARVLLNVSVPTDGGGGGGGGGGGTGNNTTGGGEKKDDPAPPFVAVGGAMLVAWLVRRRREAE